MRQLKPWVTRLVRESLRASKLVSFFQLSLARNDLRAICPPVRSAKSFGRETIKLGRRREEYPWKYELMRTARTAGYIKAVIVTLSSAFLPETKDTEKTSPGQVLNQTTPICTLGCKAEASDLVPSCLNSRTQAAELQGLGFRTCWVRVCSIGLGAQFRAVGL